MLDFFIDTGDSRGKLPANFLASSSLADQLPVLWELRVCPSPTSRAIVECKNSISSMGGGFAETRWSRSSMM
jgi:hypothetical protein